MKKTLTIFAFCTVFLGCHTENHSQPDAQSAEAMLEVSNSKSGALDIEREIKQWKQELFMNGEVGPPCMEDYEKWSLENPRYYWGMQELTTVKSDFNSDGIEDALVYFTADNCVGGSGEGSDFAMLLFSHDGGILTNKNLSRNIEDRIKLEMFENGIYGTQTVVVSYKSLTKTVDGNYIAWKSDDALCCPSYSGTFKYNPVDFSMLIRNQVEVDE